MWLAQPAPHISWFHLSLQGLRRSSSGLAISATAPACLSTSRHDGQDGIAHGSIAIPIAKSPPEDPAGVHHVYIRRNLALGVIPES